MSSPLSLFPLCGNSDGGGLFRSFRLEASLKSEFCRGHSTTYANVTRSGLNDGTTIARRLRGKKSSRDLDAGGRDIPTAEKLRHHILNGCHAVVSQHENRGGLRHYLRLSRMVFYIGPIL